MKQLQTEQRKYKQEINEYEQIQVKLNELRQRRQKQRQSRRPRKEENEDEDEDEDGNDTTMMVDLGHGAIYCRAKIFHDNNDDGNDDDDENKNDNISIFINIGLGFHVECTGISYAKSICQKRVQFLQRQRIEPYNEQIKQVQEHLSSARTLMDQLQQYHQ